MPCPASESSLYQLNLLYTQGLLSKEEYLERRRALLTAVLSSARSLPEQIYPYLESSENSTVTCNELRRRRADAASQLRMFKQQGAAFAARQRHRTLYCRGAVLLLLVLLSGGTALLF